MHTNDIRLIAMDMDGTLLNSSQRISGENVSALREARAKGIQLAICSGRLPGDIAMFLADARLEDCAILSLNGAYCLRRAADGAFASHTLSDDTLNEAVRILRKERLPFGCFAGNRLAIFEGDFAVEGEFWGTNTRGRFAPEYLYGMDGLERVRKGGVNKLLCMARDEAAISRVRIALGKLPGMDVTSSWSLNLELMPAGVCKGAAVRRLARELGLDAWQVMAVGDYDNDESMIACAGLGVAMGNASECARRAAGFITLGNDQDGVAWAIRRYAL